jgi:NAD(P)-dependent dehydrogenase (short-subunit alcohol dehydrogenase family)
MVLRLEGKVAIVMGAGSSAPGWSNGKACAAAYAREGAAVLCVDFDAGRAEEAAGVIAAEGHVARALRADATREDDVEAAVAYAVSEFGGLDIMHNNVGVGSDGGALHEHSVAAWDRELDVSLKSAFLGMRAAIPRLQARGGGAIVNISSIAAVRPLKRGSSVSYSAAKAGVEAMTRVAAADYGPENIRVNCIRIGFCDTPLVRGMYERAGIHGEALEAKMKEGGQTVPLRHERTQVWDVANAAVFLACDEARHITGVILNVDGGLDVAPI